MQAGGLFVVGDAAVGKADVLGLVFTASALTDVFYVTKRFTDVATARATIRICLQAFEIAAVDRLVLQRADELAGNDFEDNVQIACAEMNALEAVVTRDLTGFTDSPVPVWSPEACLANLV